MTIRDKILIVEDEQSIARFISAILNANGYETIQPAREQRRCLWCPPTARIW